MQNGFSLIGTEKGVIISGSSSGDDNAVRIFNGELLIHLPSSKYKHNRHGSVVLDDKLYLIAGFHERRVERLDFDTNKWEDVDGLPKDRYDFATAKRKHSIYLVGGIRGLYDKYTRKIERFHDDKWSVLEFTLSIQIKNLGVWNRGHGKFALFGG